MSFDTIGDFKKIHYKRLHVDFLTYGSLSGEDGTELTAEQIRQMILDALTDVDFLNLLKSDQNFKDFILSLLDDIGLSLADIIDGLLNSPAFLSGLQNAGIGGSQILGLDGEVRGASSNNFIAKIGQRDLQQLPRPTTLTDNFDDSSINFDAWEFWNQNQKITNGVSLTLGDGAKMEISESVKNGKGVLSIRMQTGENLVDFFAFSKQKFNFKDRKLECRIENLRDSQLDQTDFGIFPSVVNGLDYGENTYNSFINASQYAFWLKMAFRKIDANIQGKESVRADFRIHPYSGGSANYSDVKIEENAKGGDFRTFRLIHSQLGFLASYGGEHYGWKDLPLMNLPFEDLPNYKVFWRFSVKPHSDVTVDLQYVSSTIGDDTGIEPYSVIFWNPKRNQFEFKKITDVIALANV